MFCKYCGAALPKRGFICSSCGRMMSPEQIKMQKSYMAEERKENRGVELLSDKYSTKPISRNYEQKKENKFLGFILILLILIFLVIVAILKVM